MLYEMDEQNLFKNGESEYMVIYVDPAFTYISPDDASINQIYRRKYRDTVCTVTKVTVSQHSILPQAKKKLQFLYNIYLNKFLYAVICSN